MILKKIFNTMLSIAKPFKLIGSYFKQKYLAIKNKNYKADFAAWKNSKITKFKAIKPYAIIFSWYILLIYLLLSYILADYSYKLAIFAFAVFFVYEKLRDDYIEVVEIKKFHREN